MKQELRQVVTQLEALIKVQRPAPLIYIGQPYATDDIIERLERVSVGGKYLLKLIEDGKLPFSPICQCHSVREFSGGGTTWDFWRTYDFGMLEACDELHVLTLPGWEESVGLTAEIDFALTKEIPIKRIRYIKTTGRFVESLWETPQ